MSQGKSFAAIYAEMNAKKLDENVEEVKASETVEEVAEDQEQLDELSKKTLGSYINKANRDSDMSSFRSGKLYGKELATKRKTAADREQSKKENHNSQKREKGISMAVKKLTREETEVEDNQEHIEETAAADTIKTHPTSFSSKASMMANVMGAMSAMTSDECVKWFDAAMNIANSKHMAQHTGGAEDKRRSVEMKGDPKKIHIASMKEDVAALFGSDELTEEFKDNATTLFESAVHARVISEVARIEEEYAEQLVEEVENIAENLVDLVDKYLDHAVSEWMTENEVAIESSLRNELAESFMLGMKNVFAEHYCEFPEDKVDLVSALSEKVEELEEALNNETNKTMELSEQLAERSRDDIFAEVSAGLALTQKDKFETLAEGVAFDGDTAGFKKKLELIKEHHFGVKAKPSLITEQVDDDQEPTAEVKYLEPQIAAYARAIKTTLKR